MLATSVNPLDLQTRRGDYRDEVALPAVIGNDVSGVVVETGPGAGDVGGPGRTRRAAGDTLARSPEILAEQGRSVSIVDIPEPQNLLAAWAVNATYHFLFVSPGRAKLRPVIGAVVPLDDIAQAHTLSEGGSAGEGRGRPRGKIAVHPREAADQWRGG